MTAAGKPTIGNGTMSRRDARQLWLPVGVVVVVLLFTVGGVWNAARTFTSVEIAIEKNSDALRQVNVALAELRETIKDGWSRDDMRLYIQRLKDLNPSLAWPEVRSK